MKMDDFRGRLECHAVLVAHRFDIPYNGIAKHGSLFWLFDRVRTRNDGDYFLLFPLTRSAVEKLLTQVIPGIHDVDALLASTALLGPSIVGLPADDAYRQTWNDFVGALPDAEPRQAYWATVEIAVNEAAVNTPEGSRTVTSLAMTFLVQGITTAVIPKQNMILPLASEVRMDRPLSRPPDSREMPF